MKAMKKIITTSNIYFAKTHYFGIESFWKLEIMHYNLW